MPRILSTCQEGVSSVTTHTQGAYNVTDAVFPILWDKPEIVNTMGGFYSERYLTKVVKYGLMYVLNYWPLSTERLQKCTLTKSEKPLWEKSN